MCNSEMLVCLCIFVPEKVFSSLAGTSDLRKNSKKCFLNQINLHITYALH